jgi:DNA/RNA endonuclease G (NUC1)
LSTEPSDDDYNGLFASSSYARGHLAPYAVMGGDRNHNSATAETDDFDAVTIFQSNYMSNISPRHHVAFNGPGGVWFNLERWVQDEVVSERGQEVWKIAGCVFGQGTPEKVGPAADISVPPMFFKLVIRQEPDIPDAPRVLAFLMPHHRARHGEIEDFLVSVDVVEALAGLDFLNQLDDDLEAAIEDRDTFESWAGF